MDRKLAIDDQGALPFKDFNEYMRTKLSAGTRMKLRRKVRACGIAQVCGIICQPGRGQDWF
jgi:hypothetical protein